MRVLTRHDIVHRASNLHPHGVCEGIFQGGERRRIRRRRNLREQPQSERGRDHALERVKRRPRWERAGRREIHYKVFSARCRACIRCSHMANEGCCCCREHRQGRRAQAERG